LKEKIEGRGSETYVAADVDASSRESKTEKAFTQLNIINILCKQKPADKYFPKARETASEFVALVIILRFLLVNKKWS